MKLTAILLFVSMLQVHAKGFSQSITLHMKNAPFEKVLMEIKKQSGYFIIYGKGQIEKAHPVDVDITGGTLEHALQVIFKSQPVGYSIKDKFIVVSPKTYEPLPEPVLAPAKPGDIHGTVKDEKGNVLTGISVKVKGTATSTTTNNNGEFLLKDIPENATLILFGVNVETTEIKLTGKPDINIVLAIKISRLDEVQIIGYGTTTRRTSTGSYATVNAEELAKQPVANPLQALSGRMPGVLITEASGTPGAGISVQIRGLGSLVSGTNPLYIIDGVPYLSEAIYSAGGNTATALRPIVGSSPLNAINPADIESIDVLKDADATAIYGSRGSNGVILITTKKGKPGKTRLDVNVSNGFTGVANYHRVRPMALAQYLEIRRAAFANSGVAPTVANAPDLLVWDTVNMNTTDFQKVFTGSTAKTTDASVSFSGGNQQTNFLLSGSFHHETAVVPGDNYYNRGAIHFTTEHNSLDRKFSAIMSGSLVLDKNNNIARNNQLYDMAGYSFFLVPNFPLYDSTGKNLYWINNASQTYDNPLKYKYQNYTAKNNNLIGNITLKYTPVTGLNIKLSASYNKITANTQNLIYSKGINPYTTGLPSAFFQQNISEIWNVEPLAEYTRNISKGRLMLLAGTTFQDNTFNQPYFQVGTNYNSDALLTNPQAAGSLATYVFFSEYKYQSVFGRLNYNWINKYILNVNYRWDASSKFGINKRYGSFASVGGAWVFTEEDFLKHNQNILQFGKLRASYGITGNDQIGNYQYMDTYSTSFYGYNNVAAVVPSRIPNPDLEWEINKKMELGLELGFLKDNRIMITGAWFRNRTGNPLVNGSLSNVTGFSSYMVNLPATIQQQGAEFTVTTKNIESRQFSWTTNFNITFADTKLVSFPGIEKTDYNYFYVVGKSMSSKYGFHYQGIDATTSLPSFEDANKNGSNLYTDQYPAANGLGDFVYLGKSNPDFYGGLNNSFTYKGLQLDVFIQFVGHSTKPGIAASSGAPGYTSSNMYSGMYDLFKETNGKIATRTISFTEGSAYVSYYKYLLSDAVLSDGAYARLKNVSLSYAFNNNLINKIKMTGAQVYVRAQNLFTVTNYKGLDPESGASNIPPLRTITAGVKFSF